MTKNNIKLEIQKCVKISYSFEWGTKLLKELGDNENYEKIYSLKKSYEEKAFDLMRENNINQIEIDITNNIKTTLTISNKNQ
ncbi:hypothetical protein [Aliarcobacter cryaerophilus]|uniref:hypothetical protein n=1 Tax=Aliarcobacter cryaerophilus TaxID=28198 RepID=UPI0021B3D1F2|nr:hypothetical protein [Aliarcobacter cryaerophilus]MCT7513887.1 hypothetical protein [Aliarcobacter cryaerophilus]MCT7518272.1 hypothetical protein [Aliarcobacter cryaerophilus]